MRRLEVTTEGRDRIGLREFAQRVINDLWMPDHLTPDQAAHFAQDYLQRAMAQELKLLVVASAAESAPPSAHQATGLSVPNLFDGIPSSLPGEVMETLAQGLGTRIERIISMGHASPDDFWYDQEQNEWVVLLQGAARLRFDDRIVDLGPGDYLNIPAHQRHRVDWTTPDRPTVWLAVFYSCS